MNPVEPVAVGIRRAFEHSGFDGGVLVYLFGSSLTDPRGADDIDVLVVYSSCSEAHAAREVLNQLSSPKPLDVTLLTFEEEATYDFVRETSAVRVYP